ncbi:MAG: hypothetical protein COX80_00240 [Candidatus Magasanikbacteria bacterium CG_4_10_14_0_2_um_filter_33_14]|uniref:Lipocalin-like domain-containing protein n=1 Tax=Candidatus Magasanikbacteria bacterium CG_4_10_14_0_2_um_filter_33_14 TaxID=1974636 RepID=A0A2M7VCG1_9BACT|nr:MAG: hypothetical protein COX80_00240 [Candidatus Magasanikbacteria bacterium CG_4_10_14_0_2_um_filter_33_14]
MKKIITIVSFLIIIAFGFWLYFTNFSKVPITAQNNNVKDQIQEESNPFVGHWKGANNSEQMISDLKIFEIDYYFVSFELGAYYGDHFGFLEGKAIIKDNKTAVYTTEDGVEFKFVIDESNNQIKLETTDYSYQAGANVRYDDIYVKVLE